MRIPGEGHVSDWTRAFGRSGKPERFYAHNVDFGARRELVSERPVEQLVPRWGSPETSWPLVYVSAHGYGVAEAALSRGQGRRPKNGKNIKWDEHENLAPLNLGNSRIPEILGSGNLFLAQPPSVSVKKRTKS